MSKSKTLHVTTHVGRDLLQSAAVFKHERLVVWEYVANGLEYIDVETAPIVRVRIDTQKKEISIVDNGRGMTWEGLDRFFIMHGENIDRKRGKPGRGLFGTGKSAAFGIAGTLRVTTVSEGRRSAVELRRTDIEQMGSGEPIPVRVLEQEEPTDQRNGTQVEICGIHLKKIDRTAIIKYIEMHIARWPNAAVYVGHHLCEFAEPAMASKTRFSTAGSSFAKTLGEAELCVKVSKGPLQEEQQGIMVFSSGVWLESTLAGSERREMAQYIFGEIDVPAILKDNSPIPAFDLSRSMTLNRSNELVQQLNAFIGLHVEEVRRDLVKREKQRRASRDAKRLADEAAKIARLINEDFATFKSRFQKVQAKARGATDLYTVPDPEMPTGDDLVLGGDEPADEVDPHGDPGRGDGKGGQGSEIPNGRSQVTRGSDTSESKGREAGARETKARARGGFAVDFRNMGEAEPRAKYERSDRTIFVNLDHPQLKAALGGEGVDKVGFRRLAYEVALAEYAIALSSEMFMAGFYMDASDSIFEIRQTLDRISRSAASLYSSEQDA